MKVKELIKELEKMPPDRKVMVRGYEGGANDVMELETYTVMRGYNEEWYEGEYDIKDQFPNWWLNRKHFSAVFLRGKNREERGL